MPLLLLTIWYIIDASCTHLLLVMVSIGGLTSRLTSFRCSLIVGGPVVELKEPIIGHVIQAALIMVVIVPKLI